MEGGGCCGEINESLATLVVGEGRANGLGMSLSPAGVVDPGVEGGGKESCLTIAGRGEERFCCCPIGEKGEGGGCDCGLECCC